MKSTVVVCVIGTWLVLGFGHAEDPDMVFGKLRYAIGAVEDKGTILRNHINLAHLHCPGSGWAYNGFPDRATFNKSMASGRSADELRARGAHPITYIAPYMWYGDKDKARLSSVSMTSSGRTTRTSSGLGRLILCRDPTRQEPQTHRL